LLDDYIIQMRGLGGSLGIATGASTDFIARPIFGSQDCKHKANAVANIHDLWIWSFVVIHVITIALQPLVRNFVVI
jgi:hypothetical protein